MFSSIMASSGEYRLVIVLVIDNIILYLDDALIERNMWTIL